MENFDDIDEQLQKLEAICDMAWKKYLFYWNEFESETEKGFEIPQSLTDKLDKALKDHKKTIDNWHTLQRFCAINKVDLTKHWIRLGFSEAQIQQFASQL